MFFKFCFSAPSQWIINQTITMWVKCRLSNGFTKILHNMFWKSAIVIYSLLLSDAQKLLDSGLVKRFVAYFLIVQRA